MLFTLDSKKLLGFSDFIPVMLTGLLGKTGVVVVCVGGEVGGGGGGGGGGAG